MTLAQVCQHSLPQLRMLAEACEKERAETAAMNAQTTLAAIAAGFGGKPGAAHFKELVDRLLGRDTKPPSDAAKNNRRMMAAQFRR